MTESPIRELNDPANGRDDSPIQSDLPQGPTNITHDSSGSIPSSTMKHPNPSFHVKLRFRGSDEQTAMFDAVKIDSVYRRSQRRTRRFR